MSVLGIGAVRSCGATTLALGLAATWPSERKVLLIEADPAGGTLAAAAGFPAEPSLVSLAAAVRRTDAVELAIAHTHALPGGGSVLTAPCTAEQMHRALVLLTQLLSHIDRLDADIVIDCGRLDPLPEGSEALAVPHSNTERLLSTDVAIIVTRPQLSDLHALGGFLDHPRLATARSDGLLQLVVIGDGPYDDEEIAEVLGVPIVAHLPFDSAVAVALATLPADARELRRSALVRELRSLAASFTPDTLEEVPNQIGRDTGGSVSRGLHRFRPLVRLGAEPGPAMNGVHQNGSTGEHS